MRGIPNICPLRLACGEVAEAQQTLDEAPPTIGVWQEVDQLLGGRIALRLRRWRPDRLNGPAPSIIISNDGIALLHDLIFAHRELQHGFILPIL